MPLSYLLEALSDCIPFAIDADSTGNEVWRDAHVFQIRDDETLAAELGGGTYRYSVENVGAEEVGPGVEVESGMGEQGQVLRNVETSGGRGTGISIEESLPVNDDQDQAGTNAEPLFTPSGFGHGCPGLIPAPLFAGPEATARGWAHLTPLPAESQSEVGDSAMTDAEFEALVDSVIASYSGLSETGYDEDATPASTDDDSVPTSPSQVSSESDSSRDADSVNVSTGTTPPSSPDPTPPQEEGQESAGPFDEDDQHVYRNVGDRIHQMRRYLNYLWMDLQTYEDPTRSPTFSIDDQVEAYEALCAWMKDVADLSDDHKVLRRENECLATTSADLGDTHEVLRGLARNLVADNRDLLLEVRMAREAHDADEHEVAQARADIARLRAEVARLRGELVALRAQISILNAELYLARRGR